MLPFTPVMPLTKAMVTALILFAQNPRAGVDAYKAQDILSWGTYTSADKPFIGLALSWASDDPSICVELKQMEPSAVCGSTPHVH